jgi:uncharacterized repeat protein (TIGR01451 family)
MKYGTKFWHLLQGLLPILLGVLAVGGVLLGAQPASAQDNGPTVTGEICMQKVFGAPVTNSNRLNCTANDVRISRAISVSPDTCTRGTPFTLEGTFEIIVTANARYDAGFFFRIDGGPNARGDGSTAAGKCSLSALTPGEPPSLDLDGDVCGDLNAGTYEATFTIPGVACEDTDGDGFVNLPNCTSWHSNQATVCDISEPFSTADASDFRPDTKSKCVCDDTFQVPVTVEQATITVEKTASPTSVPEPGGTVTYTVQITNNATIESVTISTIVDDLYGDLGDASNLVVTDNTCLDLIGDVLGPKGTTSCTFKASVAGSSGDTVTDIVTACVTQNGGGDCDDDDASVEVTDVFTEPTLTKTAQSATCQVDVTYQVVVNNNSEVDELTVNSLTDDKFGTITTSGGNVVSTGCSVPQTIAPLGNYTCSFVGRISNSCNFTHTDVVTGNVTDDDGVTREPTDSATVSVSISGLP